MPFYKAGDGFVTAPKIPVKTSLMQLAIAMMIFFTVFATVVCKTYLDKKNILNL